MFDDTPIQNPLEHGPLTPEQHPAGTRLLMRTPDSRLFEFKVIEWSGREYVNITTTFPRGENGWVEVESAIYPHDSIVRILERGNGGNQ